MESGYAWRPLTVRRAGPQTVAKSVMGTFVSGNYFRVFGLAPMAGRFFVDADDQKGAAFTAVMSYDAWQQDYAGDPTVVGSTFYVNTKPVTIIGVAPKGFYGDRLDTNPPKYFCLSMRWTGDRRAVFQRSRAAWAYVIGRVKPGVSLPALQAKTSALLKQEFTPMKMFSSQRAKPALGADARGSHAGGGGIQNMQDNYKDHLKLLTWIAALVLLVACANIANLLLVRGMSRRAELSIRSALGAQRTRIVRQLLTESILLAGMGACLGSLSPSLVRGRCCCSLPRSAQYACECFAFAAGDCFLLRALARDRNPFGLAPAVMAAHAQPAEGATLECPHHGARSFLCTQRSLVVLQAALSLVLLVAAGLFVQSLSKVEGTNMRLDATNRYIIHINPQAAGYKTTEVEALYRTIEDRFHALPGVVKVGLATYTPMEENNWGSDVKIQGEPDPNKEASWVKGTAEYFDSVGTHVVMGRGFKPQDTLSAPPIAVVNQEFVKQFFGTRNPIGHRFGNAEPGRDSQYEIVGVVEDTTYSSIYWKDHAMYFLPLTQRPANPAPDDTIEKDLGMYAGAIVVQTSQPTPGMEKLAGDILASINPNLTIVKFQTFRQQIDDRFTEERLIARLTALFGLLALLLAAIGLYGVTAYTVVRRTPEIGIRMALGAARGRVIAMVMRGAMLQALIGLAIGIPVAVFCVRYVKSQLYEITSVNFTVMAGAIAVLAGAAAIAGIIRLGALPPSIRSRRCGWNKAHQAARNGVRNETLRTVSDGTGERHED